MLEWATALNRGSTLPADIIIIGAGIAGLSSAYELAEKGASVTVLDRGRAGMEASWAGGGILFPLLPWDYPEEVTALAMRGAALYPDWTHELLSSSGIDPEYVRCGMKVLEGGRSMENAAHWCAAHDVRFERGPGGEWFFPDVAQVRNPRLIRALRASLESRGVRIVENCEVRSLAREGRRIVRLGTSDGNIWAAQDFVVCAGAWSKMLLEPDLPGPDIFPVKGQMLLFEAANMLDTILLKDDLYLVPRKDGHILAGSTLEHVGFDKSVTAARMLHEKAAEILPGLAAENPVRQWAGLRPGSPGNVPTIARHPDINNLYLNSGHFRYGVTMAPASAKRLAQIVFGEPSNSGI